MGEIADHILEEADWFEERDVREEEYKRYLRRKFAEIKQAAYLKKADSSVELLRAKIAAGVFNKFPTKRKRK